MKKITELSGVMDFPGLKKLFRIMKLTTFLILLSVVCVFANSVYSQTKKLNLSMKNATVKEVLSAIEDQSEFKFMYSGKVIDVERQVAINEENLKIEDALKTLFAGTDVNFTIKDRIIVLFSVTNNEQQSSQQQKSVSGKVTDSSGSPLPGVSIVVKGTTKGVITDANGSYSLTNVPENATLQFSFVGMKAQEIGVTGKTSLNVKMEDETVGIEEVVAVGYGTMKKSDVTGSVGSVSSNKLVEQPSVSPIEALAGKIAGVSIYNGSGRPGGDFRIKIRGMGSINAGNNPLYIIDGIVGGDINLINTNDIETMNILKDASATAIYGAQGANGVVIITTKRAEKGKVKLTYDGSMSIGNQAHKIDLLDANQFMEMRGKLYNDIRKYRPGEAANLVDYKKDYPELFNSDGTPKYNTDWQDETTQTAVSNRHFLAITGSTDKFSSGLSIGYQNEEGILKTTFMEKSTARFFGEYKMNDWLNFGADFTYGYIKQNRLDDYRVGANTPTRVMVEMPSIFPVKYPDGRYSQSDDIKRKNGAWDIWYGVNSVGILDRMNLIWNDYQVLGNFYMDLKLSNDLNFRTSYGRQMRISNNQWYINKDWDTYTNKNQADLGQTTTNNWQFENLLTYNKTLGNHVFGAMAGASWYSYDTFGWATSASEFADDYYKFYNIGLGTDPSRVYSGYTASKMNSYFARANYSYLDKYLATATIRYDGSSRFGENNRYATFPSVALGWRISEEDFLKDNSTITNLKLRASYGMTGNNAIGDFLALGQPGTQTVIFNKQKNIGSSQGTMPNSDLKWEKSTEFNIGIDVQFFKRIMLNADYYNRETSDLLYGMPVTQFTGYSNAMTNIGSTLNKGLELTLETQNILQPNFKWNTAVVFSTNQNIVQTLGTNNADLFVNAPGWWNSHIMRVGEKMASFYGYTRLGTWGTAEAAEAAKYNLVPGDIKLEDVNKDYKYDIADRKIIGNAFADYEMNINNTFIYKNWDLSIDIQVSQGAEIADASIIMISDRYNYGNTYTKFYENAWTPENQNTMRPRVRPDLERFDGLDTGMLFDGSFVRGKNLILGYNVPSSFLTKFSISQLRLYASAQNFFLITEYHGFDPEVATYGNQFAQGLEMYGYPKAKTINFGLKVTF